MSVYDWTQHHLLVKLLQECARNALDKAVLLILKSLFAALGSRVEPVFGTYWIELLGAALLKGAVVKALCKALALPPPPEETQKDADSAQPPTQLSPHPATREFA